MTKFVRVVVLPFVLWTVIGTVCFRGLGWGANLTSPDDNLNVLVLVYAWPLALVAEGMNLLATVLRG